MKHFAILLLVVLLSFSAKATTPDYTKLSSHPRLILKSGDIDLIKQKLERDAALYRIHALIEERANSYLSQKPIPRKKVGKRILSCSRAVLERVTYCSYMYLVSGEEAYARRAEHEMLSAANYIDWNPSHFLDVGEMTAALAIGYDWLYDYLSVESRRIIEDAIIEKGLRTANPKMGWYSRANNWNQVCNAGMVMGALAIFERIPDEAKMHIERALKSNPVAQECYGPDGVYPEGFGYWEYGTWYEVMLIESLRTALGTSCNLERAPGFLESAEFMNFMKTPTGRVYNFSDSGNPTNMINPLFYWFAIETGDMSLVWQDREVIHKHDRIRGVDRLTPMAMLFAARCDTSKIKPIEGNFWYGQGAQPLFLYRSGFNSREDSYLGAKGGTPKSGHAHMDSGSFVYEWGGVRWAIDLGSQNYYSLEKLGIKIWAKGQKSQRWSVYRLNNYSHNTLTVNGKLHRYEGNAEMVKVYNSGNKHGGKFDMGDVLFDVKSASRTIYINKRDKVTCIDEIKAGESKCRVRWNMVTPTKAKVIDDRTISLTQKGRRVILRTTTPNAKAYVMGNNSGKEYDVKNKGTLRVGFDVLVEPNKRCKLKVEIIPQI